MKFSGNVKTKYEKINPGLPKKTAEYLSLCETTIDNLESEGLIKGRGIYRRPNRKKSIVRFRQEDFDNLFLKRPEGRPGQKEITG